MSIFSASIAATAVSVLAVGLTAPAALAHGGHHRHAAPVVNTRPVVVEESAGTATVTITLRRAATREISLDWSTSSRGCKAHRDDFRGESRRLGHGDAGHRHAHPIGRATAGEDYTATSGTLVVPVGATTASVTVPVVDDATAEPSEIFLVRFRASRPSAPSGATAHPSTGRGSFTGHLRGHRSHFRHSLTVPVLITDDDSTTSPRS